MTSKDLRLKMMNEILNGMKVFIRTSHIVLLYGVAGNHLSDMV